ncbi:MAG TPA: hypothetical protein VIE16_01670 [Phenylobacterium sp.]|jgi:hypothetical protein
MPADTAHAGSERRVAPPSPRWIGLAALALAGVAFVTLCPIGLRPHLAGADKERFAAFLVLGALFGRAAGRRGLAATAAVVLLAFALELAQGLAPGRHAASSDALVKALGGVTGVAAAQLWFPLRRWRLRAAGQAAGGRVAAD